MFCGEKKRRYGNYIVYKIENGSYDGFFFKIKVKLKEKVFELNYIIDVLFLFLHFTPFLVKHETFSEL